MNALTVGGEFDGIGLLAYGLHLAGLEHRWLCEVDPWRRSILARRFPGVPVFDDVRAVGARSAERVDVIAGGFPCKGASTAGKRAGFDHPETVLWREMARTVGELRPRYVLVENVANILALHDGAVWGEVLGTLAALGYDTVWDCLPAAAVGAPHRRDRVFAVATDAKGERFLAGRSLRSRSLGQSSGEWSRHVADEVAEPASDTLCPGLEGPGLRRAATDGTSAPADTAWLPEGGPGTSAGTDGQRAWPGDHAPADAGRERGELRRGPRRVASPSGHAQGEAPQRQRPRDAAGSAGEDAAHAVREGRPAGQGLQGGLPANADVRARGVGVDWGSYAPAIRRWEAVHGPAPEPLVRRVDARDAARVERSRLSALGDGVQVQVGRIAGEYIATLERDRVRQAA